MAGIVDRPRTSVPSGGATQHTHTPTGASSTPSTFWSRKDRARGPKRGGLARALALGQGAHARAGLGAAHDDEAPRLRQPDRRRAVRRLEHAFEQRVVDRVGPEAADVAAPVDDRGERGAGGVVESPAARVGGAVGRARGVELGSEQRSPHAMRPRAATVRRWMRAPDSTAPWTACAMAAPIAVAGPAKATSAPGGVATQIASVAVPVAGPW